jgi:hypothetical protein
MQLPTPQKCPKYSLESGKKKNIVSIVSCPLSTARPKYNKDRAGQGINTVRRQA